MAQLTITEALAELKTLVKRLDKKFNFVAQNLARPRAMLDPNEKAGGTPALVAAELQGIHDLEERRIRLRTAINRANATTSITVSGQTRTIEEWLTWRKDVLAGQRTRAAHLQDTINKIRKQAQQQGFAMATASGDGALTDVIVHVDEIAIQKTIEQLEEIAGTLDGQLSLKNATVVIDVA